jgi:diguanylate cyclase (GGDEF)-like protein/PAS domain S-box-containing protein
MSMADPASEAAWPDFAAGLVDTLFRQSDIAITVVDRDLRFVRANLGLSVLRHADPAEVVGKTVAEVLPDVAHEIEEALREVFATGQPVVGQLVQTERPPGSGHVVHWLSSRYPVFSPGGEIAGVASIIVEVTDRESAYARLEEAMARERESHQILDAIFESAPVALALADRDLRYIRVNWIAARNWGLTPEAMIGRTPAEVIHPDAAGTITEAMRTVLDTGAPVIGQPLQSEVPRGSGHSKHWLSSRYPVRDAAGRVVGVATIAADVTELREAEARLDAALTGERDARLQLDTLFESSPVAITFADKDLRYLRVNSTAAANWGCTPEEMVGRRPDEVLSNEFSQHVAARMRAVVESGEPDVGWPAEAEVPPGSGQIRHWLSNRYPVRDEGGEVVGVATIAADVTELREAEARLDETLARERHERALLDLLFARAPNNIAIHDRNLRYVRVNEAFARSLGRRPEDYVGKTLREMHPGLADRVEPALREVLETGEPYIGAQIDLPVAGGGVRRMRSSRYPIRAAGDEVIGIGVIADDVTDLVEAEQQVRETLQREREAHALLDTVFGQAPVGLSFVDRDLRFVRVNRAFAAFGGMKPEQILGRTVAEAFPDLAEQIESATRRVLESGQPVESQLVSGTLRGDSQGIRYFSSSRYPVVDSAGNVYGVASIVVDVTDLKQAEEVLSRENSRLESEATTDPLTGLPNRRLFEQHARSAVAYARRAGRAVGVLYLDLDGFKAINDTLGHSAGDALLREVGARARTGARESDIVARIGGDEFVVLLPDLRPASAEAVAESVARRLVELVAEPIDLDGRSCRVGASVGISLFPRDAEDEKLLLERADRSMYERKRNAESGAPGGVVTLSRRSRRVA